MAETTVTKIPSRTERYAAVMAEAANRAQSRFVPDGGSPVMNISDVFEALCIVHPEAFGQLLGRPVSVPKTHRAVPKEPTAACCHSSEVDRYLSPYGGVITKVLSSFASEETPVDSLHIAGALLWEPIPEVQNLLSVCGISPGIVHACVTLGLRQEAEKERVLDDCDVMGFTHVVLGEEIVDFVISSDEVAVLFTVYPEDEDFVACAREEEAPAPSGMRFQPPYWTLLQHSVNFSRRWGPKQNCTLPSSQA